MAEQIKESKPVFQNKTRDLIAASIVRVQKNIKWSDLSRMVAEFEVELKNLREMQEKEEAEAVEREKGEQS